MRAWVCDGPFRCELLGCDRLDDLARELAGLPAGANPTSRALLRRLRDNAKQLRRARDAAATATVPLTPDAEWLLDNFYVIEDVIREVKTDLPSGYYAELPVATAGPWAGLPRVYGLAVALISCTDSHLDDAQILRFAQAYQTVSPLATGELWAVPTMLRLALLENLRRLADDYLAGRDEEEAPEVGPSRASLNQVSIGNSVTSLRLLNAIDWAVFFEAASPVEAVLRAEPAGVYLAQDFPTRDRYRQAVERLARASRRDEAEVARLAVERAAAATDPRARHIGYHLVAGGRPAFAAELGCRFKFRERLNQFLLSHPYSVYFGLLGTFTAAGVAAAVGLAVAAGAAPWVCALVGLLALLPASEVAVALTHTLVCRLLPPRVLSKFDFADGIPAEWRTVVVIPGMLFRPDSAAALAERLELHHLANPDLQLRFALLTDWADAPTETAPTDAGLVQAAIDAVRRLNERYFPNEEPRFFLFHRRRLFNPAEGVWMGWERKRGKLDEFNRLLRGATDTTYAVQTGDAAKLNAKFVLTLDADTVLPKDAARRLIGTLAHPLNRPVLSADGRRVVAGYGVLQPRVNYLFRTGLRSRFARAFAGSAGIDPYSAAASDVYQDLFGEGTFTGKGLYDVDAFEATAGRAFPENAILSHDLIESTFARCGLVTDIELFDDFPAKYLAFARREHRWTRGDWQLLPWLGRTVRTAVGVGPNVLSLLSRWKVFDNLRRSLVPAALVAVLAVGWALVPGAGWAWTLLALTVLGLPLVVQVYDSAKGWALSWFSREVAADLARALLTTATQIALTAAFLANQAATVVDAIGRTLYRLFVSRKHLLEWETAAAAEARLGGGLAMFVRAMLPAVGLAVVLAALVAAVHPVALPAALPWLLAWVASPLVAWSVSRPLPDREPPLTPAVRAELRLTARKTWRFFETFVGDADHWLPPDNYQEVPKGVVAHRTSPTNVGLLLLSTLSAHDLGYLPLGAVADRLRRTFDTLDRLETYRGHFLNWYDTVTLVTLPPAYVSTVDSGNLLACLLVTKHGLTEKADEVIPPPTVAQGLLDTAAFLPTDQPADELRRHLADPQPERLTQWDEWLTRAGELAGRLSDGDWTTSIRDLIRARQDEVRTACPWVGDLRAAVAAGSDERWQTLCAELDATRSVAGWADALPRLRAELAGWAKGTPIPGYETVAEQLVGALNRSTAPQLADALESLGRRAVGFVDRMDFRFLYNPGRHLFTIGFDVPHQKPDAGHYDLLASESCVTSFLMVARGVVPRKHWFMLGRLVTRAAGRPGLVSWGGTMFEYLMPRLLLPPARGTLLDTAQRTAVARHVEYGRQLGLPWGVSESGFAALGPDGDYQYQSFGVPGLGLKRGLAKDRVVAPYATLLAVQDDPAAAVANFARLRADGGEGAFGFYEAIDYTPGRVRPGRRAEVVKSYMAHHQGMGLCAIANRLTGDALCRRLRAEPAVRAVELLLHERVPTEAADLRPAEVAPEGASGGAAPEVAGSVRRLTRVDTPAPRPHLLSNGRFTTVVTHVGGGGSTCDGRAVTRWRPDATRDYCGSAVYVRDVESGEAWSAGHLPMATPADYYEAVFCDDKAEFRRRDGLVETVLELTVAPDADVEVRRLTLINNDIEPRTLAVTSYAEPVLLDPRADLAHPAFGKLFLETDWLPRWDALVCRRRPRSPEQPPVFAVHVLGADPGVTVGDAEYETDRMTFLGRRRSQADPDGLARPLTGAVGPVLDPVFAVRKTVRLEPGRSTTLTIATAVTDSREAAERVADHYHAPAAATRAFELAWAHSRVELRRLGITAADSHLFQRLAGHVLFPPQGLRAVRAAAANRQGQPGLWRHGISGDLPILLVVVGDDAGLALARQVLKAQAFWRGRGFVVDLVLIADKAEGYREELAEELNAVAREEGGADRIDKPGGVFIRRSAVLAPDDRTLLFAAARVVLSAEHGTLAEQVEAAAGRRLPPPLTPAREPARLKVEPPAVADLEFFNGTGGFTQDGREYVIVGTPPAPWANVLANPAAGCLVTEGGLGATWVENSQQSRLTPWANDPVTDPPAEGVYLRDEDTGRVWSPTPQPAGADRPTVVRHGAGYTVYEQGGDGLAIELTVFVPVADPVKVLRLVVRNRDRKRRALGAAYYAEWVLGTTREQSALNVVTEVAPSGTLLARSAFAPDAGDQVAFADTSLTGRTVTGDRAEFIGPNRTLGDPAGLSRIVLSGQVGAGLDPCAALLGRVDVPPNGEAVVVFVIGRAADAAAAERLAVQYRDPARAEAAFREVIAAWDRRLSAVTVSTPDRGFDLLVNRWLLYQTLACRVWGRTALYQSGGAYGFRDQLQDVLALLDAEPSEARTHILRAAGRQFREGDVQHWWHPPAGQGVRTRFADDFLWLPYAVATYVKVTGDFAILNEPAHYLDGPELAPDQHEAYFRPTVTADAEPLYRHCLKALERGWRLGPHGLPLMGGGDWNDGMNLVGIHGRGESVWLAWFQVQVRRLFADVAVTRGESEVATHLRAEADQLLAATEAHAWDGGWYKRAWFDDGTPLGSAENEECRIDSLTQSWAVICGTTEEGRAERAVDAALEHLVSPADRLIRLFTPPFDKSPLEPGYIKGYLPGIRENGGQYTHAAIWLVQAVALLGRGTQAMDLWRRLSPVESAAAAKTVARYKVEPYAVVADVYGEPPNVGRGGWTWYTGSAGWLYRVAVETLLGITRRGNVLTFDPHIPGSWDGFGVDLRIGTTVYSCRIDNPARVEHGVAGVWVDGVPSPGGKVCLVDDGRRHEVRVELGNASVV